MYFIDYQVFVKCPLFVPVHYWCIIGYAVYIWIWLVFTINH